MKTKYAIAASLLISVSAIAQKDELKAMKKIMKEQQPTAADLQEFKQLLDKAEPLMANADNEQKAEYYYYKGNYSLVQTMMMPNQQTFNATLDNFNKVIEIESNGKKEYTKEIQEQIYPELRTAAITMAQQLSDQKKYKEAAMLYGAAYDIDKNDPSVLYNAAASAVNAEDYDAALKYYMELDKSGWTGEGTFYTAKNVQNGTVETFPNKSTRDIAVKQKLYTDPKDEKQPSLKGDIVKNIALIYLQKGDNANAMKAIEKAKKENPDDLGLLQAESQLYYEQKDMESYQRVVKEILNKGSKDPNLYFNLGVTTAQAGQVDEAKQYYKKAVEIDPKYANAYYNLSILELTGEEKIVDEMNNLGTSKKDIARYDILKKKRDDMYRAAVVHAKKAYDIDPQNEGYIALLSTLYMGLDMMDEAKALKNK